MRIAGLPPLELAPRVTSLPSVAAPERSRTVPADALLDLEPGLSPGERLQATSALEFIPPEDRELLARNGVRIRVLDAESVPRDPAAPAPGSDPLIGATTVYTDPRGGSPVPTAITVAARPIDGTSLLEVLLHETGHAVSVLRTGDRTEEAAERYAGERIERAVQVQEGEDMVLVPPYPAAAPTDARDGAAVAAAERSDAGSGGLIGAGAAIALLALALFAL